jgi:hypothetical protein
VHNLDVRKASPWLRWRSCQRERIWRSWEADGNSIRGGQERLHARGSADSTEAWERGASGARPQTAGSVPRLTGHASLFEVHLNHRLTDREVSLRWAR